MVRRSRQLHTEVEATLAEGTPPSKASISDWKRHVAAIQFRARSTREPDQRALLQQQLEAASAGLRAAQRAAANQPLYVTDTNLFALKEMVLKHGPTFPSRVPAVDAPHLRRTVAAGLVEVTRDHARLTSTGRVAVADAIVEDIRRESSWQPRENPFVPAERRGEFMAKDIEAHNAKVARLEATLEKIR